MGPTDAGFVRGNDKYQKRIACQSDLISTCDASSSIFAKRCFFDSTTTVRKNAKICLSSSTKKTQYGAPPFAPDETPVVLKIICIFNTNLGSPPPARGGQPFVTHPWVKGDVRDRRARTLTVARRTLAYRTHARASARASANRSGAREKEAACLCSFASAFFLRAAS